MKNFTEKLKIKVMKEDESYHEHINKMIKRPEVKSDKIVIEYGNKISEELEIIFGIKVLTIHEDNHCPVYRFESNKDFEFFLNIREWERAGERMLFFIRNQKLVRASLNEEKFNNRATFLAELEKKLQKVVS